MNKPVNGKWRELIGWFLPVSVAFMLGSVLLLALHEGGKVLRIEYTLHLLIWVPVLLMAAAYARVAHSGSPLPRRLWPVVVLLGFLLLAFLTGWSEHRWFYFLRWNRPTWPHLSLYSTIAMVFFLLTALLTPVFLRPRTWLPAALWLVLGWVMIQCLVTLYQHTGWALLIRDDHPSFAFRIWKVTEVFPRLESYVPCWNGGEIHAYALTSGALGPALLMFPFIKWFSIEQVYTPAVGVLFIVGVPLIAFWAARIAGLRRSSQVAAAFLALCTTHFYYLWLLQFGTLGANFASAFVMPFAACLYRALYFRDRSLRLGVYTVVSGVFLLMWPPGVAMAGLITLGFLCNVRQWSGATWRFLLICAACVVLIQLRVYLILVGSDVWGLISTEPTPTTSDAKASIDWFALWAAGINWLRAHFRQAHPMLLFLGVAGTFLSPYRRMRNFYAPILAGMLLLTMLGPEMIPILQLERMIIPLLFAVVIPSALCVGVMLDKGGAIWALPRAMLVALLILTGANTQRLWNNEGLQRHQSASPEYFEMVDFIRDNVPENTRLLFAGRTVHSYGGGHVALLPYLTGREMMACDYYHFDPAQIEYNYPPRAWRESPEDVREFLRIYNVSMVTSRRPEWIEHLRAHPHWYEEVRAFGDGQLVFFRVRDFDPSPFLHGIGQLSASLNRIEVVLERDQETLVLSYNWHPRLATDGAAELFPVDKGHGVVLVGVRPHGEQYIVIRHPNRI